MAEFLARHPKVEKVYYPGLPDHPYHAVAKRTMRGFGGLVTFLVKGADSATARVVDAVQLPRIGPSLGGVESLIEQPLVMSYFSLSPEERQKYGISDNMIRLSCGVENTEDLLADLAQGSRKRKRVYRSRVGSRGGSTRHALASAVCVLSHDLARSCGRPNRPTSAPPDVDQSFVDDGGQVRDGHIAIADARAAGVRHKIRVVQERGQERNPIAGVAVRDAGHERLQNVGIIVVPQLVSQQSRSTAADDRLTKIGYQRCGRHEIDIGWDRIDRGSTAYARLRQNSAAATAFGVIQSSGPSSKRTASGRAKTPAVLICLHRANSTVSSRTIGRSRRTNSA